VSLEIGTDSSNPLRSATESAATSFSNEIDQIGRLRVLRALHRGAIGVRTWDPAAGYDNDHGLVCGSLVFDSHVGRMDVSGITIMGTLTDEKCTACRRDSPRVIGAEVQELTPQIPECTMVESDDIPRLERVFRFTNFAEALNFTNRGGALAEEDGHPPAILTEWGRVTVTSLDPQDPRFASQRLHHGGEGRFSVFTEREERLIVRLIVEQRIG
jgi:4a-hydroxytetrahydrobiopterin dehydratase